MKKISVKYFVSKSSVVTIISLKTQQSAGTDCLIISERER